MGTRSRKKSQRENSKGHTGKDERNVTDGERERGHDNDGDHDDRDGVDEDEVVSGKAVSRIPLAQRIPKFDLDSSLQAEDEAASETESESS